MEETLEEKRGKTTRWRRERERRSPREVRFKPLLPVSNIFSCRSPFRYGAGVCVLHNPRNFCSPHTQEKRTHLVFLSFFRSRIYSILYFREETSIYIFNRIFQSVKNLRQFVDFHRVTSVARASRLRQCVFSLFDLSLHSSSVSCVLCVKCVSVCVENGS